MNRAVGYMLGRYTRVLCASLLVGSMLWGSAAMVQARRHRTTRPAVQPPSHKVESTLSGDTLLNLPLGAVQLSGYDKPRGSNVESLFILNTDSVHTLERVVLDITYSDMRGNQLHRRCQSLNICVPAGQRRQAVFRSWDRQNSMYYHLSPRPRQSRQATPYTVTITPVSVKGRKP